MGTSLAEDIRILFLEGNIEIEKVRKFSYKEQKNFVTALHAEATEAVIKQMQSELNELLAKRTPVIDKKTTESDNVEPKNNEFITGGKSMHISRAVSFTQDNLNVTTQDNLNVTPIHIKHIPVIDKKTTESDNLAKPTFELFSEYYKSIMPTYDESQIISLYNHYEKINWKSKYKPINDWRAAVRSKLIDSYGFDKIVIIFNKPTLNEFSAFYLLLKSDTICSDTETNDNIKTLYNHYERLGWKSHGKEMKDWRTSVRSYISLKKRNIIK